MSGACWLVFFQVMSRSQNRRVEVFLDLISCRPPPASLLLHFIMKPTHAGYLFTPGSLSQFNSNYCKTYIYIKSNTSRYVYLLYSAAKLINHCT